MDIRELRLFLHLAESCHFGKTAAAMYISPSTLSRQIQRLEESLGHPLFLRDNRTVQLTAAGEQLKKFAQETVLQYQQLQHALNHQSPSLTGITSVLFRHCRIQPSAADPRPVPGRTSAGGNQADHQGRGGCSGKSAVTGRGSRYRRKTGKTAG